MLATEMLTALLKRHEGKRLKPYLDTTGHLTIGYGRNLMQILGTIFSFLYSGAGRRHYKYGKPFLCEVNEQQLYFLSYTDDHERNNFDTLGQLA